MNCGLADLRLVSPRDGWPNPLAVPMAAGGRKILENAVVFESLADATHDVSFMIAASARRRDLPIKMPIPELLRPCYWRMLETRQHLIRAQKQALEQHYCLDQKHQDLTMMKWHSLIFS